MRSRTHLVLAALVVLVVGLALHDSYPWSGPVMLTLTRTHGVHATDPLLLGLLALSLGLLARETRGLDVAHVAA